MHTVNILNAIVACETCRVRLRVPYREVYVLRLALLRSAGHQHLDAHQLGNHSYELLCLVRTNQIVALDDQHELALSHIHMSHTATYSERWTPVRCDKLWQIGVVKDSKCIFVVAL